MRKNKASEIVIETNSERETVRLGKKIATAIKPGVVIALSGELGTGKTTLTKGIASALEKKKKIHVTSPSFALVNVYEGKIPIYHIDCYRLDGMVDFEDIGIDEFLGSKGVAIVEWAEKVKKFLPDDVITIKIKHKGNNKRVFTIQVPEKEIQRKIFPS